MTIGSHWATCWKDSSEHWKCAVLRAQQLPAALTIMFYKVPTPRANIYPATRDDVAAWWVAELADKDIWVTWNAKEGRFEQ